MTLPIMVIKKIALLPFTLNNFKDNILTTNNTKRKLKITTPKGRLEVKSRKNKKGKYHFRVSWNPRVKKQTKKPIKRKLGLAGPIFK